jgi:hypothetical protein
MQNHRTNIGAAIAVAALFLAGASALADEAGSDHAAIEATVRDYVDGWYAGDAARMENALHPDLVKRVVRTLPDGREFLNSVSASNMVAYTTAGFGKGKLPEGYVNQVTILETTDRMAMAKSVSPEFIDYIHLAKFADGGWKIVNVLWEPVEQ